LSTAKAQVIPEDYEKVREHREKIGQSGDADKVRVDSWEPPHESTLANNFPLRA
jgi:hypothetical protein